MKRIIIFFSLCLCLVVDAYAQPLWVQTEGPGDFQNLTINFDSSGGVYYLTGSDNQSDRLFRTTNDGVTWAKVPLPPGLAFNMCTLPDGHLVMQIDTAVQLSADFGQTWNAILTIPKPRGAIAGGPGGGGAPAEASAELAVSIDGKIFVWFGVHTFRSFDDGKTWDTLPGPPYYLSAMYSFYTPTLFASGNNGYFYRSTDTGESWGRIINGVSTADWLGGSSNGLLYCQQDQGIYISNDDGRTWRYKFSPGSSPGCVAVSREGNVALTYDFDIYVLDSTGSVLKDFQHSNNLAIDGPVNVSPSGKIWTDGPVWAGPDTMALEKYVALPAGQVTSLMYLGGDSILANYYLSTDQGNTWINNPGYNLWYKEIAGSNCDITKLPYLVTSNSYEYFGSSTSGIYRSTDGGATWDNLNRGLMSLSIVCLAVDSSGNIFTATSDGIYRTTDDALDWIKLNVPASISSNITSIAINTSGDVVASAGGAGIYWSLDTGDSWNPIGSGLSGTVNCMLSTPDGHVFAGTDSGVFYLPQGGSTWENASEGLTNLDILTIIRDTAGTVYVGTNGDGMFRSTQSYNYAVDPSLVSGGPIVLNDISMSSIHPNPFSQSTQITFTSETAGYADILIVNLLGEQVAHVFSGELDAGEHNFTFSGTGLPDGIYECLLRINGQVEKQPMVLLY